MNSEKNRRTQTLSVVTLVMITVVALGVAVGVAGSAGAEEKQGNITVAEPDINIDNGVYNIDFAELKSDNQWIFQSENVLYDEFYAFQSGSGTVVNSDDSGTIVNAYPSTGSPGTVHTATTRFSGLSSELTIDRNVKLDSTEPLIETTYDVENTGGSTLSDFKLYQFVDYDIDGFGGDTCEFISNPEHIVQNDSGIFTGLAGESASANHDVDAQFPTVRDNVKSGSLANNDSFFGDCGIAMEWSLGSLAPGETTSFTVGFAAGNTQKEVEDLLRTVKSSETEGCVNRRSISRGQEGQECPTDRGISRGGSRDELDRNTGRNSDTARRDRGRRDRGRSR